MKRILALSLPLLALIATSANAAEPTRKESCSQSVIIDYMEAQAVSCAMQRIANNPRVNQEIQVLLGRCIGKETQVLKPLEPLKAVAPRETIELINPEMIDERCGRSDCL